MRSLSHIALVLFVCLVLIFPAAAFAQDQPGLPDGSTFLFLPSLTNGEDQAAAAEQADGALVQAANVAVAQIGDDPYTNTTSQHKTQVEPDTFAFGSTIVAAAQTGRFNDGGGSNICWATSTNSGASLDNTAASPASPSTSGGTYDRVSDPVVAYDARHNVWMISTLPLLEAGGVHGAGVLHEPLDRRRPHLGQPGGHSRRRTSATSTRTGSSATTPPPARSTATATPSGTTTAMATAST